MMNSRLTPVLTEITETTESAAINVKYAKRVVLEFSEAGEVLNRSGALTITGSVDDGTTFADFKMLIDNVANTNGQQLTRIASKTRNTAGADLIALDLSAFALTQIKAKVTVTDGATPTGTFSVKAYILE